MLKLLIEKKVNLNSVTKRKEKTALQMAVLRDFAECVQVLIDAGADVNLPVIAKPGWTIDFSLITLVKLIVCV